MPPVTWDLVDSAWKIDYNNTACVPEKTGALLPVWILNTRWEGKDFLFAMNGQTGKLVGNLPVSTKRVIGLFAAIAASLIAISVTALLLLAQ